MERMFVDTGAWFALFNRDDPDHEDVARVLEEWEGRLVTSDYIFDETITLLRYRANHAVAVLGGEALRGGRVARTLPVEAADLDAAWRRFVREKDKVYSFTDCTSFALMERIGVDTAAAVDPDFGRAGFRVLPSA